MSSWRTWRFVAGVILAVASSTAKAENLALSGKDRWVTIASRQNLDEAIGIAKTYSAQKSRVVRSQNGWFAVLLGPFPKDDIASFRRGYDGPALPSDAVLTRGTGYIETVWPPSAVPTPDVADNSADWSACVANPENADRAIVGCSSIIGTGTEPPEKLFLALLWRGSAYETRGDHDQAIADFDKAIRLQPDNAVTYYNRGVANAGKGEIILAISDYDKAIQRKQDFAEAYFNRGVAYDIKGDGVKALDDYRFASQRLLASDPNHDKAVKRIADIEAKIASAARVPLPRPAPTTTTATRAEGAASAPAVESIQPIGSGEGVAVDGSDAYQRGDFAAALRQYRPLAEQGDATAQYVLGRMYARGQGVPKDYALAYMWFNLAAAQSSPNAAGAEAASVNRDELEKLMPRDQIAEAQRLTREWKPTAQP